MGLSSSKEDVEVINLRSDKFKWETLSLKTNLEDMPVEIRAIAEAASERTIRDLYALFPPKLGESSVDLSKEERDEKVMARFCEFMKAGACKESFMAFADCMEADERNTDCGAKMPKLIKCVDAHSDYYQPIISLFESNVEQMGKDVEALVISGKAPREEAC